ncbi:hypothetical protein EDB92DRAFT_1152017 [Lactarius akahatsu]|uniref:Uncharacterized protein n=1 Tax=Lactarius akahatsu TaxID=416441 RepID=A0AAD4LAY8_9AGAM|nr:hypothetical protein EDB92DRAFT_1152017 [Lactarius akahatsu]
MFDEQHGYRIWGGRGATCDRFLGGFTTIGYSMQSTSLRKGLGACRQVPSKVRVSYLSCMSFAQGDLPQRNVSTEKTTISDSPQTLQSIHRHLTCAFLGFCLIGRASLPRVSSRRHRRWSLPPSLRLLPRPQRCNSTSSNWRNGVLLECHSAHFFATANEKLFSALNVPQIRGLSNGSLRLPATPVLAAIAPSAPQTSPQLSPTPAAVIVKQASRQRI